MAAIGTSISGIGLTLLVGGAGILGGWLADKLFSKTGAKDWIKSKTIAMMDGLGSAKTQPAQPQPAQQAAAQMPSGYPTYQMPMAYAQ